MRQALKTVLFILLCLSANTSFAQEVVVGKADKIIAIVGRNRIILDSELEREWAQMLIQNPALGDSMKCQLLVEMMMQKILVEQADRDSIIVTPEEVEGTIDNRIRYYVRQYGSKEKLEEISGKTIYQLKEENKESTKESLLADRMKANILQNVKITPAEVKAFYDKVPTDSLPFYPATIEIGQIVIDPKVTPELDEYARKKLEDIRKQIVTDGKSFETMAGIYSDDPGSKDNGGRYKDVTRSGGWAPEFVAAAFRLQNGEISPVIKTQYGYHIIQMIQRKGDQADLRHILVRPERTSADFAAATHILDSVRTLLVTDKMKFPEAVGKFSTDEAAKQTGGMILNPQTGSAELGIADLDPAMVLMLDTLKQGGYSAPQIFANDRGDQSTRIVYLKTRTEPHKANLEDDYSKIQAVALNQKQAQKIQEWLLQKIPSYYIKIDPEYTECKQMKIYNIETAQK